MVFASYEFMFMFLPLVLIGYFMLSKFKSNKWQHGFLVLASLYFYGYFNPLYLYIIIASIIVNYFLALFMQDRKSEISRNILFFIGIIFNIGMLGYFKYYDFFVGNINAVFSSDFNLKHILLPLGISFFTFQQFSFLLCVYKKTQRVENFLTYSLFVTYFPQLVAGPIVLYDEMIPQFNEEERRKFNMQNFSIGICYFIIGCFKKIVIADSLAIFVNNGFDTFEMTGFAMAWATSLSYTIQLYFDFSGYSDMAIGLGKMMNINLPINFNSPYKSKSITEFWKRWHITLGRALTDFIYIPLGGNRKGNIRTYLNLFTVFFISGLWHGAAWTFVIWGVLHGIVVVFERMFKRYLDKVPNYIRIGMTFILVNTFFVFFRAKSLKIAISIIKEMFLPTHLGLQQISRICFDALVKFPDLTNILWVCGLIVLLLYVVFRCKNSREIMDNFKFSNKNMIYFSTMAFLIFIHLSRISTFIYFNF